MPAGIPVATVAIGGARNAGLLAARILAVGDPELTGRVIAAQEAMAEASRAKDDNNRTFFNPDSNPEQESHAH